MEQFEDGHFFYIPSQGNIYTLTEIQLVNGSSKLLVASLKREIFCFEYQESPTGSLVPTTKEVSFTYIPNGAEIISIDAFNKSSCSNEFVIGITIIKNSNDAETRLETYLNIYSEWEETEHFDIENIAQSCLNVELNFIPYKLLHTYLITWQEDRIENKEIVFVLSGSDNHVHIYREQPTDHIYKEIENKDYFPEFSKTPSLVVWIDIYYTENYSNRITSFACECGYIKLMKIDVKTNKIIHNFSTRFGNYISRVYIFPENERKPDLSLKKLELLKHLDNKSKCREKFKEKLNLVVINTILPAVIFHDILDYGLSNYATLPRIDSTSVLTCCEVADIDFDGEKEILIGNSGQEIMLLKRDKSRTWYLEELKTLPAPIFSLKYIDMSGDGVKDLVVLSMRGVHVLQHGMSNLQRVLDEKLENLIMPDVSGVRLE